MSEIRPVIEVELPTGDSIPVIRRRYGLAQPGSKRVSIVAGIRGDAPEGIRVAQQVGAFLDSHESLIEGIVDIYPCANPLAAHRGTRLWPFFELDLNRLFPGKEDGHPPHRVARALCDDVAGSDQVIELRGARPSFREAPQALVRARDEEAAQLAMGANVSVIWKRRPGPAAPSTFAHQFPGTVVLEGGAGNRLTAGVGQDLTDGVLNLLCQLGVLSEGSLPFHWAGLQRPVVVEDQQVIRVRAGRGGLFMPSSSIWAEIKEGETLGQVVDPVTGGSHEEIVSPVAGRILAVRERPVVFPGTMVARVVAV